MVHCLESVVEVCERSSCVCGHHICKMQLLAKNSNVKESPIQTEAIGMQSPLGYSPVIFHIRKYHKPVSFYSLLKYSQKITGHINYFTCL